MKATILYSIKSLILYSAPSRFFWVNPYVKKTFISNSLDFDFAILYLENARQKVSVNRAKVFPRGGQYRGTVTRYFFSTVVGTVSTFSKKYRFRHRRYFLARLARYFCEKWN